MIEILSASFSRIAYPLESPATSKLVDNDAEKRQIRALLANARGVGDRGVDARGYLERPFQSPTVSRFSDGSFGVLYAANTLSTAIRETAYHLARFFLDGNAPVQETRLKRLSLTLSGSVRDIRSASDPTVPPGVYDPDLYKISHEFGRAARGELVGGLHYDSVRNPARGHCVGLFTPVLVKRARILGDIALVWDGNRFAEEHTVKRL